MPGAGVDRSPSAGLRASFRSAFAQEDSCVVPFASEIVRWRTGLAFSRHPLKCRALPGMADFLRRQPLFWSGILDSGRSAAPYPPASLSGEESEVGAPRSVVLPS